MRDLTGVDRDTFLRIVNHIEKRLAEHYPEHGTREERIQFFSDLDDSYRQPWIVDPILEWMWHPCIVLTGQFGQYVLERLEELEISKNYILINGRLREGIPPRVIDHCISPWGNKADWVLLDDSYYSGRTRLIIQSYLGKIGFQEPLNSVVIYNGSQRWHPHVHAVYNWYMVHGLEEFPVHESEADQRPGD